MIARKNQLIGRMVGQAQTSARSVFLTLTYSPLPDGSDPPEASEIFPKHMVDARKRWRERYGKFEYCGVAERGELKGRVHWHIMLFFDASANLPEWADLPQRVERDYLSALRNGTLGPDETFWSCGVKCMPLRLRKKQGRLDFVFWHASWPHGYLHVRAVDDGTPGYIAKYILKPAKGAAIRPVDSPHNSLETYKVSSNKLGIEYVRQLGVRTAKAGVPLSSTYAVAGRKFNHGPRAGQWVRYTMTRGMRREYVAAYFAEIARQLACGEIKEWKAPETGEIGDPLGAALNADALRDPAWSAEKFFAGYQINARGFSRLPYFDMGRVVRAVTTADDGVVCKTSFGEYVFTWPDLSGHGRDVRIPIENRRELFRAVRLGGIAAFGLHPPSLQTVKVEVAVPRGWEGKRWPYEVARIGGQRVFPLRQVLEHGGSGIAGDAVRLQSKEAYAREVAAWDAAGRLERRPKRRRPYWKVVRAMVTSAQVEGLRRRLIAALLKRWEVPPETLAHGVRSVGLPSRWVGASLLPEARRMYPAFAAYFSEVAPDAPPF